MEVRRPIRESPAGADKRRSRTGTCDRLERVRGSGRHRSAGDEDASGPHRHAESQGSTAQPRYQPGDSGGGQQVPYLRMARLTSYIRQAARKGSCRIGAIMVVLLVASVLYGRSAQSAQPIGKAHLKLAVPAYVIPGQPELITLEKMNPAPAVVILNPDNGDGPFNSQWQAQADRLRARGIVVLGYVHTDGGTRPIADTEASISNYLQSSSGAPHVSGIFLDEIPSTCWPLPYYASLYAYIQQADPGAFVVANPGAPVSACYLQSRRRIAQTFVTFEHDASTYLSSFQGNVMEPNGRFSLGQQYPATEFWHMIYSASSSQMPRITALVAARHAGWAYITDANLPNPYDTLPSYIAAEARAMAATSPQVLRRTR